MKKYKIQRRDYERVIITETIPFETPIIFSNDGIYEQIKKRGTSGDLQKKIIDNLIINEKERSTVPYSYKIRKGQSSFRRLSLLHPASQWQIKNFYEKYEDLIIYHCSHSPISIRSPERVSGSYFIKNSWENLKELKDNNLSLKDSEHYTKHAPSFFSYRGYDRLYKFYASKDYFRLEVLFKIQKTLDVSKCFDSIYTHSLSWAVTDKDFAKENLKITETFSQEFDRVIRHGNHNETNGIPIGPESSRIFAEIIFQEIDCAVVRELKDLKFGRDYEVRRYVDDIFIFSNDENTADRIYEKYADKLISFNLHTNHQKTTLTRRPFFSPKARIIHDAGKEANHFFEKFLEEVDSRYLKPKYIFNSWRLTKNYLESIKSLCSTNNCSYDEVSSFLISVISGRVRKIVSIKKTESISNERCYLNAIFVILDVLFFLYGVSPSVSSSYKISMSIILIIRFSKENLSSVKEEIFSKIHELTSNLLTALFSNRKKTDMKDFIFLEEINIILSIKELGVNYEIEPDFINEIFLSQENDSYFKIISCLFYIGESPRYDCVRKNLIYRVDKIMSDFSDIKRNSEKANLFLDIISCPYIPRENRAKWLKGLFKELSVENNLLTNEKINGFLDDAEKRYAHVNWRDVDLLNSLEKKELKQAY